MNEQKSAMPECDVVMKGGITSGVVYPLTIVELAKKYRLRNIGGTSAGALAAAITAAAEFNRPKGFELIQEIPDEVANKLLGFFQPVPVMKPLFEAVLALQAKQSKLQKTLKVLRVLVLGYWTWTLPGFVVGIALAWGLSRDCWAFGALALLLGLAGVTVALGLRLFRTVKVDMPANDFGICTGRTMPGSALEGLTDWLADTIDRVAGRDPTGNPLTFDELWGPDKKKPNIRLDMMTTNLSMKRAHRLPLQQNIYMFRKSEFGRLFPPRVVDYMIANTQAVNGPDGTPLDDYYRMPFREKLPVVVAARMSLSFPGLICTIPLYTPDRTLREGDRDKPRRCLFSDGGLTSNFPIHFFDRFLPCAPTFAVALDSWRPDQHGEERVTLPKKAGEKINMPVMPIESFGAFLMSLIDSAKGWQDNQQSTLPGYRERIVHVALDDDKEGGLNLAMDKATIDQLVKLGGDAGQKLVNEFDLDEHRWRRFLVAVARLEGTLDEMVAAYDGAPDGTESFGDFLDRYAHQAKSYRPAQAWREESLSRMKNLMNLARAWQAEPRLQEGDIPKPASDLRITARY